MKEVVLDCKNCKHGYICCRGFNVLLQKDETDKYPSRVLSDSKGIYLLKKIDGECIFFDDKTKRCSIWHERPRACREYSCEYDERVIKLQT